MHVLRSMRSPITLRERVHPVAFASGKSTCRAHALKTQIQFLKIKTRCGIFCIVARVSASRR
jgi:hypothetical protein